jgi:hypothetical protein
MVHLPTLLVVAGGVGSAVVATVTVGTLEQATVAGWTDLVTVVLSVAVPLTASIVWGFVTFNSRLATLVSEIRNISISLTRNDSDHTRLWDALSRIDRELSRLGGKEIL